MKLPFLCIYLFLILSIQSVFAHNEGIRFIENKGQWPNQVNFKTDIPGGKIWLEKNKISYQFTKYPNLHANFESKDEAIVKQHVVWAEFIGSNENVEIIQKNQSKDYTNYFLGNDPSKWATYAYSYDNITYTNFYEKTDFVVYVASGHLKYDFILKPGSVNNIKIKYTGQDELKINKNGELVVYTSIGQIIEEKPYAYQIIDGKQKEISCKFILEKNTLSFQLGNYDKSKNLVLDPTLIFASYNGSPSDNFGMTATYDNQGNLYTGGTVFGANYPTTPGVYNPTGTFPNTISSAANAPVYGLTDVFISKYEPNGTSLVYSTYLGGGNSNGGTEAVHSLICDTLGNLHLFGTTSSTDFPTSPSAFQTSLKAGSFQQFQYNAVSFVSDGPIHGTDIFVTKFNSTGSAILGSTFIGGTKNDGLNYNLSSGTYNTSAAYDSLTNNYGDQFRGEIMLDDLGYIYITSSTYSDDFPHPNGFQTVKGGQQDAVVCKFSPNLDSLIWASFLGGSDKDAGYSIKLNANYDVIVTGGTCSSTGFPSTPGTINPTYQGGKTDGFITRIDKNGGTILASTFIGTPSYDQCYFVEVDRFGSIYAVGQTKGNFPLINTNYADSNSGAFIIKLDSNLTSIDYSTVFGNGNVNAQFSPSAFLVDRCLNIYVSGWGGSVIGGSPLTGMRITTNSIQSAAGDIINTSAGDGYNFYLTVFKRNLQSQLFGIYYGSPYSSEHVDGGTSRFDKNGIVYQSVCAGCRNDDNFPTTTGVVSNTNNSANCNNGVFKFDFEIVPKAKFTVDNYEGCAPLTVTFTNNSNSSDTYLWDFGNNDTTSQVFNPIRNYNTPGTYNVTLIIQDSICNTIDTARQVIVVNPPITINSMSTDSSSCDPVLLNVSASGATSYIWSSNNQFTDTLNSGLTDTLTVFNNQITTYYVMATNGICNDMDSVTITFHTPSQPILGLDNQQGCAPLTVNFTNNSGPHDYYLWNFGGNDTTSLILNPIKTFSTPGSYPVSLTVVDSICNTTFTSNTTITVASAVTITTPGSINTCNSALLYSNTTGATSYIWSTNSLFTDTLNPSLSDSVTVPVSDTTTFYLMATNGICSAIDSIRVNYNGVKILTTGGATCNGANDTLSVTSLNNQTLTYSWQPINEILSGENTATPIVNPSATTMYYVTAQNSFGCSANDSALVVVSGFNPNNLIVTADKDTLFNGEGTYLHADPDTNFTYLWTPNSNLTSNTVANPFASPITTTTYTVLFTEISSGCSYLKSYTLYAWEIVCGEPNVYLPNAFTPNGDKENDVLFLRGRNVESMHLKIYDRWGELVFETTQQHLGWDGNYKGKPVDPAVYVYHLSVKCIDGQDYFKKGNVTVIR